MGNNPINLGVRFLLELVAWFAIGLAAAGVVEGIGGIVSGITVSLIVMAAWVTFAIPDDPSRSGHAPVPISGWMRLLLELMVFGLGTIALIALDQAAWAYVFTFAVIIHNLLSYDRIRWMLNQH